MNQQEENLKFEEIVVEAAPRSVQEKAAELQASHEFRHDTVVEQGRIYVLITLGERNTAGYRIKTERVVQSGKRIIIHAREITPPKNGFVAQVITHPLTIVAIDSTRPYDEIEVNLSQSPGSSASGGQ